MILVVGLLFLFALIPQAVSGQKEASGSLGGFVYDQADGEALINASVFIEELEIGTITNTSGYYVIPDIPVGQYTLVGLYIGYRTARQTITIKAGTDHKIDLNLAVEALAGEETIIHADSMRTAEKLFRKPLSRLALSARQISRMPQIAEADLLRSLQSLPGILPLSDFSSALYVRGGTPDQNLYLLDGTDVYNPEHAFGIFSTFNTEAIKQAELSKGGFGASYGGRLSSVLDVTNLDGNREEFEGSAAVSLLSAKTTLQMPLGRRGSLSGSVRRTYFDQTVGRRIDDIPTYYFYDGNLKAFFDLGPSDNLTLSFYGGRDFLDVVFNEDATESTGFDTDWGNKTASLRWTRILNPSLFANFWITGSRFSSDFNLPAANVKERNFVSDLTVKGHLEHHLSRRFQTQFGFEQKNLHVLYRQSFTGGLVDIDTRPKHYILYGQSTWRPSPFWEIEAGLRYNHFRSDATFNNVGPRLALKYRLSELGTLKFATGTYYQYLHRVPRFIATDIWTTSNNFQNESRSHHFIAGYQREVAGDYQFEVEGFYKTYDSIYSFNQTFLTELRTDSFDSAGQPIFDNTGGIFNQGDGNSRGLELLLRKERGALTGWLGYSLAATRYTIPGLNLNRQFAPRHDRTSTLNLTLNLNLRQLGKKTPNPKASKLNLGINFVYSSGQPFTEPGSGYVSQTTPNALERNLFFAPTRINNIRFPPYTRLDLSLTYERHFKTWSIAPYLQIFNIGNRRNVWFVDYEYFNGQPKVDEAYMFPLLPTIGFNLKF